MNVTNINYLSFFRNFFQFRNKNRFDCGHRDIYLRVELIVLLPGFQVSHVNGTMDVMYVGWRTAVALITLFHVKASVKLDVIILNLSL